MTVETRTEQALDAPRIVNHLRDEAPGPLSLEALAEALELDEARQPQLQELLNELTAKGSLVETRHGRFGCPERMNLIVGTLRAHPDGFAFVAAGRDKDDLFVPGQSLNGAMHGDRVVGRIEHRRRSGRIEGRVIRILSRARERLVGAYREDGSFRVVRPIDPRLGSEVLITGDQTAKNGEIVTVQITDPPKGQRPAAGTIVEVIGDPNDSRVDVEVVIREFELRHEFPAEVLAEAEKVATEVTEDDIEGRTDFRSMPIVTIDGETAQDFDDAVHVELRPDGTFRLHVHIADVSHYVKPGSAIDTEAIERATSVYFVDRVLPMLPEQLSNEICSLKPEVDRLVQSVLIDIDRDGRTVNYEFHDGVIKSAARLTYKQVAAILKGDEALRKEFEPFVPQLERMAELANIITRHRRERGSIDFDLPDPEVVLNLRGETEDVIRSERNDAHRLIEEFMVRANEVVASHLQWEAVPAMYRVHEGPDPDRVERLRDFLSGLGHTLGGGRRPQPRDFMELLERVEGRPEERVVTIMLLRSMKQARYQVDNDGHFGLASQRYTHFTSPIRRYPDLVIHRALRAERASVENDTALEFSGDDLGQLAAHCSTVERKAEEAERRYADWKKLQFMVDKVGETYEGHIISVQSFGCFVELEPFFVEGLIPVSSLDDDYYRFDEAKHTLRGERTDRVLKLGDRVRINVAKVDMERRHLDFQLLEGPLEVEPPPPPKRRRRRKRGGRGRNKDQRSQQPDQQSSDDSGDDRKRSARGEDSSGDEPKRRRRRGRRGGRRRRRGKGGDQQSGEQRQAESGRSEKKDARSDKRSDDKRSDDKRQAKDSGGRRDQRGDRDKRGGDRDRGKGRGRGKRTRDRGRSGSGRTRDDSPRPAPQPVQTDSTPQSDKGDSKKPAVNPYLTDIDF